jgi:PAS domain S-box-containing protein
MKIKGKLIFSIIAVVVVVTLLAGSLFVFFTTNTLQVHIQQNLSMLTESYAEQINTQLENYEKIIEKFSSSLITGTYPGDIFEEEERLFPEFKHLFYTDKAGNIIDIYPYKKEYMSISLKDNIYWRQGLENTTISAPTSILGYDTVFVFSPMLLPFITLESPTIYGVATVSLPLEFIFKKIEGSTIGKTGHIFVVDENGLFLYHNNHDYILNKSFSDLGNTNSIAKITDSMDGYYKGSGEYEINGKWYYIYFYPITKVRWTLAITGEMNDITQNVHQVIIIIILIFITSIAVTFVVVYAVVNRVVKPINQTVNVLRDAANGKSDLTEMLKVDSHDEISEISEYFKTIVTDLKRVMQDLNIGLEQEKKEKRKAEKTLYETETRFKAIFNQTFQFIWLIKPDGAIIDANQTLLNYVGLTNDRIRGRYFWEAPWWPQTKETANRIMLNVEKAALGEFVRDELKIFGAGNEKMEVDFSIVPVKDNNDNVILLIPEARDITDRKQAEIQLIKLSSAVEQSPTTVIITDPFGTVEYANARYTQMSGFNNNEILGKSMSASGNHSSPKEKEIWKNVKETGEQLIELHNKKKNGESYWELATILPLKNKEGKIVNLLKLSKDITEKKRIEKELEDYRLHLEELVVKRTAALKEAQEELLQKEKFATLGKLTATVSHEIRNPLATIGSSIYYIQKILNHSGEQIKRALARAARNVKRCDQIIEYLLSYTKKIQTSIHG